MIVTHIVHNNIIEYTFHFSKIFLFRHTIRSICSTDIIIFYYLEKRILEMLRNSKYICVDTTVFLIMLHN